MNIVIEFRIFKLVLVPNFSLNWQFRFFWPDFPKRGFSGPKQKKWALHIFYIILPIQISLVEYLARTDNFFFFLTKFTLKGISSKKPKKVNIVIEFCMFKLFLVPNFHLNNFDFFWLDLPKKGFSSLKQKKVKTKYFLYNSAHSN